MDEVWKDQNFAHDEENLVVLIFQSCNLNEFCGKTVGQNAHLKWVISNLGMGKMIGVVYFSAKPNGNV